MLAVGIRLAVDIQTCPVACARARLDIRRPSGPTGPPGLASIPLAHVGDQDTPAAVITIEPSTAEDLRRCRRSVRHRGNQPVSTIGIRLAVDIQTWPVACARVRLDVRRPSGPTGPPADCPVWRRRSIVKADRPRIRPLDVRMVGVSGLGVDSPGPCRWSVSARSGHHARAADC